MPNKDWLPFKSTDTRKYHELTTEEKKLRHIESIDRNIRFLSWLVILAVIFSIIALVSSSGFLNHLRNYYNI
jgi:hypothetical protein